jgi:Fe-S cluster assembly iron-binding protein IscA
MLEVTDAASSAFRTFLDRDDVNGNLIKLVAERSDDGETGIGVQPIDHPGPNDVATRSTGGVVVVLAPEIAPSLEGAVLDARQTDTGADLFVRAQSA